MCCAFLVPSLQGQTIFLIALNFFFFMYLLFFKPSESKLTNVLSFSLEIFYIGIEILFLVYFNITTKTNDIQYGFGLAFCIAEGVVLFVLLLWTAYRAWISFKDIKAIKEWLQNIENAKDFEQIKKDQQKRDLAYDFGEYDNRSQEDKTENADEIIEGFGRVIVPKNKPKIRRDDDDDHSTTKEKFNILDVDTVKVRRKEDELLSEEELGVNKPNVAGRLKKNSKG